MNVVAGKDACDYIDAFLAANLFDDVTHPQLNRPTQNLVAIFCCPNDVIAMVENAVFPSVILHLSGFKVLRKEKQNEPDSNITGSKTNEVFVVIFSI